MQTLVPIAWMFFVSACRPAFRRVFLLVPVAVRADVAFHQRARVLLKFFAALHLACDWMNLAVPSFALERAQIVAVAIAIRFVLVEQARLAVSRARA